MGISVSLLLCWLSNFRLLSVCSQTFLVDKICRTAKIYFRREEGGTCFFLFWKWFFEIFKGEYFIRRINMFHFHLTWVGLLLMKHYIVTRNLKVTSIHDPEYMKFPIFALSIAKWSTFQPHIYWFVRIALRFLPIMIRIGGYKFPIMTVFRKDMIIVSHLQYFPSPPPPPPPHPSPPH